MNTTENMLDVKALAVRLGVSRTTIYRAARAGTTEKYGYKTLRVGWVWRFEKMEKPMLGSEQIYQTRLTWEDIDR